MIRNRSLQPTGFTLVELMIAMAFVSLLLLAIAAAIMQVGAIYSKGTTMKSVNQAGRVVVTDMKRVIGGSQPFDVAIAYRPHDYYQGAQDAPDYDGGRLCTGTYSYIWNIGKYINTDEPRAQVNRYAGADSERPLRLVRVHDNGGSYCEGAATGAIQPGGAVELLSDGNLAVQGFTIERVTDNIATGMALYSMKILISDANQDAIDTIDNTCKPPSEDTVAQNYCAVNEFTFTARAGNRGD